MEIARKRKEVKELSKLLKECKLKMLSQNSIKVSEIHFFSKYESYLTNQIGLILEEIENKNKERKIKLDELVQKSKETKTFEKLEEKHFEKFLKETEKLEQTELDEIAVQEFIKE